MAVIEMPPVEHRRDAGARAWRWTAGSGLALVLLATLHIVAQHFVVRGTGGLRTYRQVIDYIANPAILVLECGFMIALAIHAMLGLRSVLFDFKWSSRTRRRIDVTLWVLGSATVLYGMALVITLAARS